MKKSIKINNIDVSVKLSKEGDDYISLTDMAKFKDPESTGIVIAHWLSSKYTVQFMGSWEQMFNPNFNVTEFSNIKNEAGSNGYILSSSSWIKKTNAIGIRSSAGRYGGTFAHKDIAFEFATWLSPEFKLYLIKEFQRLKIEENERLALGWDVKRMLTKINYKIHTDAIKESIIVPQKLSIKDSTIVYANEADVLNKALFGMTAKEWRDQNPKLEGNIRDYADVTQLVCLANLENLNAEYIRAGLAQGERLLKLNDSAIVQMQSLIDNKSVKKLENDKFFNNKIMKNTKINFTRGFSLASLMFSIAAFLGLVHMATTTPDVSVDLNSLPVASTTMNVDFGANTSANPVTTANNNQSYSAVLKNCTNGRVVNSLDGWHCDISESEVASSTTDQPAPVITSISPTSAMVGDTIVVTGNNLKGFEGDTNLWIQNVLTGAKGMIVKNDAGGSEGSGQNIKFTLANKYCTVDTSYSGLACPSYLTVTPGNYVIYANPWGSVSNQVLFKVVGSKISIPLGRFLLPDGNYSATIGGTYRIAWNPADFGSSTLTIRLIDESKNCAPGIVGCQNSYIISSGIQNNGTYSWDTTKKMGGSS
ncbi:MAG: KilA-N domain-containing protein, partial [Patescibacteria group bacterium]|nr:KilA-N domain-containing protein [Patescibacteria group bacterium]